MEVKPEPRDSSESSESNESNGSKEPAAVATHSPARTEVPMALLAAVVLPVVSSIVFSVRLQLFDFDNYGQPGFRETLMRWRMISSALPFAWAALAIAGAFELMRRTSERARLGAQVVLGAFLLLFVTMLASHYALLHLSLSDKPRSELLELQDLLRWTYRLRVTCWLAAGAGMLICGWRERGVRVLAAPLLVASLLATPYEFYAQPFYALLKESPKLSLAVSTALDLVHLILAVLVLRRGAPLADPGGGWDRAARALDRAGSALFARLWIAAGGVLLMLLAAGNRGTQGIAKLWFLGVPLCVAVTGAVLVSGVLGAAGLTAPRAPRFQLYAAAALLVTTILLSTTQLFTAFGSWPDIPDEAKALPLLLPALGALALIALSLGLRRLADLLPSLALQAQAGSSATIVALAQLVAAGIQYTVATSQELKPSSAALWTLLATVASLTALISLARMCRALALQIRERSELPTATLLPK